MKVNSFDKQNLKLVISDVKEALKKVEDTYGIELSIGSVSFDDNSARTTINFSKKISLTKTIKADTSTLSMGLAKPGTAAWIRDHDGMWKEVIIKKARQKKYLFCFKDNPGKEFIGAFHMFHSSKP